MRLIPDYHQLEQKVQFREAEYNAYPLLLNNEKVELQLNFKMPIVLFGRDNESALVHACYFYVPMYVDAGVHTKSADISISRTYSEFLGEMYMDLQGFKWLEKRYLRNFIERRAHEIYDSIDLVKSVLEEIDELNQQDLIEITSIPLIRMIEQTKKIKSPERKLRLV